jgi:putative ABC transport system permease protein
VPLMNTPLAWLQLMHQQKRTLVAVAGVSFALVLIFMQLGFYGAVEATSTLLYDKLDFDLILMSPSYVSLLQPGVFPREQLYRVRALPEVADSAPLYINFNLWRSIDPEPQRRLRRRILIVGIPQGDKVFQFPALEEVLPRLHRDDTGLMDRLSRDILGPRGPGVMTEVGLVNIAIVGEFTLGQGLGADGLLLVSEQTFAHIFSRPSSQVSLGLIRLRNGADPATAAAQVRSLLPPDVQVLTRAELVAHEQNYWVMATSVGIMFRLGVVVAMIAGMVFIYQVIASDVRNNYMEYATLKAIGYRRRSLSRIIMHQSLILAGLSYVAGLGVSLVLYDVVRRGALIPIAMTPRRLIGVLVLAMGFCSLSGLLCLRKVRQADPADLF